MVSRTKHLINILCVMIVGFMFSGIKLCSGRRNFDAFILVCLLVSLWFWYDLNSWKETLRYVDFVVIVGLTLVLVRLYIQEETLWCIYCGECVFFSLWFRHDLIRKRTLHYFFLMALQTNAGHGLLILDEVSRSHTTMHQGR